MTSLPTPPIDANSLPDRRVFLDVAWVLYFGLLLVAPVLVPPFVAISTDIGYSTAIMQVVVVVGIGYLGGLATLIRPA